MFQTTRASVVVCDDMSSVRKSDESSCIHVGILPDEKKIHNGYNPYEGKVKDISIQNHASRDSKFGSKHQLVDEILHITNTIRNSKVEIAVGSGKML